MAGFNDITYGLQGSSATPTGVDPKDIIKNPFLNPVDPGVNTTPGTNVDPKILNTKVPGSLTSASQSPLQGPGSPAPTSQSLLQRLLGTMPSTGFFSPENDYTGVSGTITRKGAHIAVANELEKIKFVAGTFGGMQNRVAIIRYWSRKGATSKAVVASESVDSPAQASVPSTSAQKLAELAARQPVNFDASAVGSISPTSQVFPIPDTSLGREVQPGSGQVVTPSTQPTPAPTQTMGPVLSATPGARSAIATSPTEAAWQFLFNPEELQLESGPEFNKAETWGVSDLPGSGAANSGQPLAWRFNKNRKLIFGKVLLTGYVLGRRVDSLEKGLQQLFMARSGPGMDGPPVLEFVWGSRVFGPCVIQNLRVRERAWDDGYLVNAEVSFDLEQVPEWTINDGAVDIARPGRQSLVNDPFLPRAEPETAPASTPPPVPPPAKDDKGGGGGSSTQDRTQSYNDTRCQRAYYWTGSLAREKNPISQSSAEFITNDQWERWFSTFITKLQTIFTELRGFSEFWTELNAGKLQNEWDSLKKTYDRNFFLGGINGTVRKQFLLDNIQKTQNRLGAVWNNKTTCPNTAGKSVTQSLTRPNPTTQNRTRSRGSASPRNLF